MLTDMACHMMIKHHARADFEAEDVEGRITTTFGHACLGSISGMLFEAEIETHRGKIKVRYIVKSEAARRMTHGDHLRIRWVPAPEARCVHPGENAHLN